jgi:hypothetical protein
MFVNVQGIHARATGSQTATSSISKKTIAWIVCCSRSMEHSLFKAIINDLDEKIQEDFNRSISLINSYNLIEHCLEDLGNENSSTRKVSKSMFQLWNAKVVNICHKAQSVELKSIGIQLLYETIKVANYEVFSDNFKQWLEILKSLTQKVVFLLMLQLLILLLAFVV